MRTTIIIYKRGEGYSADVAGQHGGGSQGQRVGLTAYDAATAAARLMLQYGQPNPEGASLMAPAEVLAHVPVHLRELGTPPAAHRLVHLALDFDGLVLAHFADSEDAAAYCLGKERTHVPYDLRNREGAPAPLVGTVYKV